MDASKVRSTSVDLKSGHSNGMQPANEGMDLPAVQSVAASSCHSGIPWAVFLVACCLLLLVSGCGNTQVYSPKEPVTVQFVAPGSSDFFAPLVEEFESQHANVTIELAGGPFRNYEAWLENDVIVMQSGFLQMVELDDFVSLNAFISEDEDFDLDDFYPSAVEALSVQGQVWAIPYMANVMVMVYNRDLFDKYNVPYPDVDWTWEGFLERAQGLTHEAAGEYGYAYQQLGGRDANQETMAWIYQHGGQLFDDLSNPTRVMLNEPLNVQALQWYADLIHEHGVAPSMGERQVPYPLAGIEGGKYAMWMGYLDDDWGDLNVGMAPLPRDETSVTFGTVLGPMISAGAEDPRACWEWVAYLSEKAPPGLMPARRSLAESDAVKTTLPFGAVDAARVSLPNLAALALDTEGQLGSRWGTVMQAYNGALAKILNGDSVQAALDEAQTKSGF